MEYCFAAESPGGGVKWSIALRLSPLEGSGMGHYFVGVGFPEGE